MIKNMIFDFDGTIADTLDFTVDIYNSISSRYSIKSISTDDLKDFQAMKPKEILKQLDISLWRLPLVAAKILGEIHKNVSKINLISDMGDVLKTLNRNGYRLFVVTSNSVKSVETVLSKNGLDFMDYVHHASILKKDKAINYVIKEMELSHDKTIYIGDEYRDVIACKKIGLSMISVDWGFSSNSLLKTAEPDYLISKPKDILKILNIF